MTWSGPTTNLTHRWPLDTANGGNDVVGALNGTVNNATQTTGPSGVANTAYHLDSPAGYVSLASSPISFTAAWSVGYWVKFDSLDSYAADGDPSPIDFDDGGGHSWRSTFSDTNETAPNQYISESGTPNREVTGLTLTTGVWYHKVVTFDGSSTYKVYLNGSLLTSGTDGTGNGTTANNVFGGRASNARNVHGAMAQVVAYSKELTSGEVSTLYAADSPGGAAFFGRPYYDMIGQAR